MDELYSYCVENVFLGFIQSDPCLLRAIDKCGSDLRVDNKAFLFTVPALFEFTCLAYEKCSGLEVKPDKNDYLRFRKSLYSNLTNSYLKGHGGQVEIELTNKDHDLNVYKLIRNS